MAVMAETTTSSLITLKEKIQWVMTQKVIGLIDQVNNLICNSKEIQEKMTNWEVKTVLKWDLKNKKGWICTSQNK